MALKVTHHPFSDVTVGDNLKHHDARYKNDKMKSCRPYHVSKGGNEEEEDGEDADQCAVCTRLDYFLGYSLQGSWEELEYTHTRRR